MGNVSATFNNVGWIWDGQAYSFFTVPGSTGFGTTAGGINAPGQVVGYFQDVNGNFHGFLKHGSTFTQIDVPGATGTFAYGINDRTDVVGWYLDQQFGEHGFVLSGGTFMTIDVPGSLATLVTGINNNGELVGLWFDSSATHGFLASHH
jgi:probable HAF family extracellular repeat protein